MGLRVKLGGCELGSHDDGRGSQVPLVSEEAWNSVKDGGYEDEARTKLSFDIRFCSTWHIRGICVIVNLAPQR